jgi:ribosomal protein S30
MKRFPVVSLGGAFVVVMVLLAVGVSRVEGADSNMSLGNWKLNVAKSKYDPGPAPKSATRTYEPFEGDGIKFTSDTVNADGSHTIVTFSAHYDGKPYPVRDSANRFDMNALKRVDAYLGENTLTKAGKIVQQTRTVISKDGKTMTATQKSPPDATRRVNNVLVFEKQ